MCETIDQRQGLLTEKEVADQIGKPVYWLWRMRRSGKGIPFLKMGEGKLGRVRYRRQDVDAYLADYPTPTKAANKKDKPGPRPTLKPEPVPLTMTCRDAAARHPGVSEGAFARMCLRGKAMAKRYGGASKVPAKKLGGVIFARKIGRSWQIPISELDRVFLGKNLD